MTQIKGQHEVHLHVCFGVSAEVSSEDVAAVLSANVERVQAMFNVQEPNAWVVGVIPGNCVTPVLDVLQKCRGVTKAD